MADNLQTTLSNAISGKNVDPGWPIRAGGYCVLHCLWFCPSVSTLLLLYSCNIELILFIYCIAIDYTPRTTKLLGGYTGFTPSVRPSVCPSVRLSVRPSLMPCPLCIIYSYGWILFILGTNDHYHERVWCAPWPLTLTYIFKVIWPWLRKSCPLCSVYSSGWILPIFGTNYNYH